MKHTQTRLCDGMKIEFLLMVIEMNHSFSGPSLLLKPSTILVPIYRTHTHPPHAQTRKSFFPSNLPSLDHKEVWNVCISMNLKQISLELSHSQFSRNMCFNKQFYHPLILFAQFRLEISMIMGQEKNGFYLHYIIFSNTCSLPYLRPNITT